MVDGRTPEHGYIISSPSEPDGSGELNELNLNKFRVVIFTWNKLHKQFHDLQHMGGTGVNHIVPR